MDDHLATTTAIFRQALPYAVLASAPGLAARYVTRARFLDLAASFPDACIKCGTYLYDGSSEVRVMRLKTPNGRKRPSRTLRHSCLVCGHETDVALRSHEITLNASDNFDGPDSQPAVSDNQKDGTPAPEITLRNASLRPTSTATEAAMQHGNKKRRPIAGLQEMLSRNRVAKNKKALDDSNTDGNLITFLNSL
ncbi:hypothetical protein AMATHDRAFT_1823 [Amanita thiersii Skay4041]|uniref:Rpr2-domain-containing protein n=1 Tax=Amanita thiersii Skay4041 TaxID=703135 RepID=A0A2A9NWQ9_9AGAR|nr:hypothetical protein AMATHDRAFT_1823 [Amanita thiersii Skay4041]